MLLRCSHQDGIHPLIVSHSVVVHIIGLYTVVMPSLFNSGELCAQLTNGHIPLRKASPFIDYLGGDGVLNFVKMSFFISHSLSVHLNDYFSQQGGPVLFLVILSVVVHLCFMMPSIIGYTILSELGRNDAQHVWGLGSVLFVVSFQSLFIWGVRRSVRNAVPLCWLERHLVKCWSGLHCTAGADQ